MGAAGRQVFFVVLAAIATYVFQNPAAGAAVLALGAVTAPGPKKKDPLEPPPPALKDRILEVLDPISARDFVYGEKRKSGQIVFRESSDNNKYLHIVITLSASEVTGIDEVFIEDDAIHDDDLDGAGLCNAGKYNGKVRIKKHLGTDAQTVDTDLNGIGGWTSDHRLRGIAYLYVRLEFDQDLFPRIPNISAWIRGKKVTETRDMGDPSLFSANPALILRDYLTINADDMGAGFDAANELDDTFTDSAANICDQMVTVTDLVKVVWAVDTASDFVEFDTDDLLMFQRGDQVDVTSSGTVPAGLGAGLYAIPYRRSTTFDKDDNKVSRNSMQFATTLDNAFAGVAIDITDAGTATISVTKKAEPRYACNAIVDSDRTPFTIIEDILSTMGGRAVHIGGTWNILAAGFNTPTVTFDEDDLRSPLQVQTKHGRRERFNAVKGAYVSPINNGVATDYPPITNSTYETQDNSQRIYADLDLPFVSRAHQAMRLAKIELERHRQQLTVSARFSLTALQVRAGDVINFSNSRMGWVGKDFEIVEFVLSSEEDDDGVPALGCNLVLRETASAVFDWANGEETQVDLAPNTNLPNPLKVSAPTSMAVVTAQYSDIVEGLHTRLVITWATPVDFFVSQDGKIEIQFKRSVDVNFEPSFFVAGADTRAYVPQVEDTKNYDVRIRAINHIGARSTWTQTLNYKVGSSFEAGLLVRDYRLITETAPAQLDYGLVTETPATTFEDWETIV